VTYVALLIILSGIYLVDSSLKNRAPIGFLTALISSDKPDLAKTLAEYNGKWTTPLADEISNVGVSAPGTGSGPGVGLGESADPRNGRLSKSELKSLSWSPGHELAPAAADAAMELNKAYRAKFGSSISVTDSYRTYAEQVATKALKGNLAATPGTSNHGMGLALDLGGGINSFGTSQYEWMMANAPGYGWVNPSWAQQGGKKPEPWHWEFVGGKGLAV
jgi:hypothetical protein